MRDKSCGSNSVVNRSGMRDPMTSEEDLGVAIWDGGGKTKPQINTDKDFSGWFVLVALSPPLDVSTPQNNPRLPYCRRVGGQV
jgi:hypothetical protein